MSRNSRILLSFIIYLHEKPEQADHIFLCHRGSAGRRDGFLQIFFYFFDQLFPQQLRTAGHDEEAFALPAGDVAFFFQLAVCPGGGQHADFQVGSQPAQGRQPVVFLQLTGQNLFPDLLFDLFIDRQIRAV